MSKYFVIIDEVFPDLVHIEALEPIEQLTACALAFEDSAGNRIEAVKGISCFTEYTRAFETIIDDLAEYAKDETQRAFGHYNTLKANADCYDANWSDGYTIEESVFGETAESAHKLSSIGYAVTRLLKDAAKHLRDEMD